MSELNAVPPLIAGICCGFLIGFILGMRRDRVAPDKAEQLRARCAYSEQEQLQWVDANTPDLRALLTEHDALLRRAEGAEAKLEILIDREMLLRTWCDEAASELSIKDNEGFYDPGTLANSIRALAAYAGELRKALSNLLYKSPVDRQWYVVTAPERIIDAAAKALALTPPEALEQQRERIRREMAEECAAIASELEDDDCTAGAVWEAIRHRFGLDQPAPPTIEETGGRTLAEHLSDLRDDQPAQQEGSDA